MSDEQQAHCPECGHNLADWAIQHRVGCQLANQLVLGRPAMGFVESPTRLTLPEYEKRRDETLKRLNAPEDPSKPSWWARVRRWFR